MPITEMEHLIQYQKKTAIYFMWRGGNVPTRHELPIQLQRKKTMHLLFFMIVSLT